MKFSNVHRAWARVIAILTATLALGGLITTPAQAGTNGQMLVAQSYRQFNSAYYEGYNQFNQRKYVTFYGGISIANDWSQKIYMQKTSGWYWIGSIKVVLYYGSTRVAEKHCWVPKVQSGSDLSYCWVG